MKSNKTQFINAASLRSSLLAAFALVLLTLSASVVMAQVQESENYVAVRLMDSSGAPVAGISPDALGLQVEGKKVELNEAASLDRHQYVVLLDMAFNSAEGLLAARQSIWKFLTSLPKEDVAAIAAYDNQSFARLLCGFTSDHTQWASALNHLERKTEDLDSNGLYLAQDVHQAPEETLVDDAAIQAVVSPFLVPLKKDKAAAVADQFTNRMMEFAKMLNAVRGEKQVLLFSPGAPVKKGSGGGLAEPENTMEDPTSRSTTNELEQSKGGRESDPVKALGDAFAASNCVVYSFDTSSAGKPALGSADYLKTLAKRTRGTYFENFAGLDQVKKAPAEQIVVGWRSTGAQTMQAVKLTAPEGMKIQAPSRVLTAKTIADLNALEKRLYLGQWLYQESILETPVHREYVDSLPMEPGLMKTIFFLQMPGQQILDLKSKKRSYYIGGIVTDANGKIFDSIQTPVRVDIDKTFDKLKNAGLKYFDVLLTPPGDYHFHGYVVDVEGIAASTVSFPFRVSDFQGLAMTRPMVVCANQEWIRLRHEYPNETKRGIRIDYPYQTDAGMLFPELVPQIANGSPFYVYYSIHNLSVDSSTKAPDPHIRFKLNPTSGQPVEVSSWKTVARIPKEENSFGLLYELNVQNAPPGNYQLSADFGDGIAGKVVTRNVSVQVK